MSKELSNDLINAIAHGNSDHKLHYMELVAELQAKSERLDFIEDFLYNGLGWSREYIKNIYKNSLTRK